MGTTHDTPTRIAMAATVLAGLELGSSFPTARVILYSVDNSVLVTLPMQAPAFPAPAAVDVASNAIANALATKSGDPDHFAIADRDGVGRVFGGIGVSGSGADMEVAEDPLRPGFVTPVIAGQPVALGNVVYRAPP